MPQLQHMGKHFPLSLLTPYLISSQWQSQHPCGVRIGLYTLSSRQGLCIGYRITKGVSERCIERLLLTVVRYNYYRRVFQNQLFTKTYFICPSILDFSHITNITDSSVLVIITMILIFHVNHIIFMCI